MLAGVGVVNRDGKINLIDVGGDFGEIDFNFFVVAFAFAGEVIAHVFNRAALVLEVIVEDKIVIAVDFAVGTEQKCRRVEVEIVTAVIFVGVPAKPD